MRAIFVVIVNYRTASLVLDCLESLSSMRSDLRGGRVVVVDNDSRDGSVGAIEAGIVAAGWSGWAEVVPLPRNGGFAYGNNAAIERALQLDADLATVVLLNPDTIVKPGAIAHLVGHLDQHPSVGIVGARIENEAGAPEVSAHTMPSPLGELEATARWGLLTRLLAAHAVSRPPRDADHACDWVSGACMAVRREVLDAVGPLDEGYFLYYEEVDFCFRAKRAGWSCWFVPEARVVHFEGASTGIRVARRRRPGYWYASRRRFFVKSYGVSGLLAADLLWAVGRCSLVCRRALGLGGRGTKDQEPSWFAFDLLWGDLKAVFNGELWAVSRRSAILHGT